MVEVKSEVEEVRVVDRVEKERLEKVARLKRWVMRSIEKMEMPGPDDVDRLLADCRENDLPASLISNLRHFMTMQDYWRDVHQDELEAKKEMRSAWTAVIESAGCQDDLVDQAIALEEKAGMVLPDVLDLQGVSMQNCPAELRYFPRQIPDFSKGLGNTISTEQSATARVIANVLGVDVQLLEDWLFIPFELYLFATEGNETFWRDRLDFQPILDLLAAFRVKHVRYGIEPTDSIIVADLVKAIDDKPDRNGSDFDELVGFFNYLDYEGFLSANFETLHVIALESKPFEGTDVQVLKQAIQDLHQVFLDPKYSAVGIRYTKGCLNGRIIPLVREIVEVLTEKGQPANLPEFEMAEEILKMGRPG